MCLAQSLAMEWAGFLGFSNQKFELPADRSGARNYWAPNVEAIFVFKLEPVSCKGGWG